jgi:hypothetical protein
VTSCSTEPRWVDLVVWAAVLLSLYFLGSLRDDPILALSMPVLSVPLFRLPPPLGPKEPLAFALSFAHAEACAPTERGGICRRGSPVPSTLVLYKVQDPSCDFLRFHGSSLTLSHHCHAQIKPILQPLGVTYSMLHSLVQTPAYTGCGRRRLTKAEFA